MQITDVRVRKTTGPEGKLKAVCSIVFDEVFVIHEVRVVEGANGIFVAMPRRKVGENEYRDLAHPITAEMRTTIQKAVLDAYAGFRRADRVEQVDQGDHADQGDQIDQVDQAEQSEQVEMVSA